MKTLSKIVLGTAAAASVLAAAPASAQSFGHRDDRGRVEQVRTRTVVRTVGRPDLRQNRFENRRWNRGERFDSRYARNYRIISNPRAYRLREAPRGYRWVQSGNDAVLVAIASGLIGAVLGNAF